MTICDPVPGFGPISQCLGLTKYELLTHLFQLLITLYFLALLAKTVLDPPDRGMARAARYFSGELSDWVMLS